MRVAALQTNPTLGAIDDNVAELLAGYRDAADRGAELVVAPEMAVTGYPPRDLLDRGELHDAVERALDHLKHATTGGPGFVVGAPSRSPWPDGRVLQNAAFLFDDGQLVARRAKTLLPTYDVFEDARYFEPAREQGVISWRGRRIALTICEDLWNDRTLSDRPRYPSDPVERLGAEGFDLLLNLSASPWRLGKEAVRDRIARNAARRWGAPVVYVNQVGAHDELIFDGQSFALDAVGRSIVRGDAFATGLFVVDVDAAGDEEAADTTPDAHKVFEALVLGVRDYFRRTGFRQAVIGISGGIDSALTAAVACEALGASNVLGITMPGPHSSPGSVTDSRDLADALGFELLEIPIGEAYDAFVRMLAPAFEGRSPDVTEENLQARARGVVLMAMSNKTGRLVLTTGNKSEMAVGYATLYGDMCGALAVLADVPKVLVFDICRWLNRDRLRVPQAIIDKPPSAELAPDQRDDDTLPPYEDLDPILEAFVERDLSVEQMVSEGHDRATVERIVRMVQRAEYKRRQAAPTLRVTSRAFGMGRRMPLTARWTSIFG